MVYGLHFNHALLDCGMFFGLCLSYELESQLIVHIFKINTVIWSVHPCVHLQCSFASNQMFFPKTESWGLIYMNAENTKLCLYACIYFSESKMKNFLSFSLVFLHEVR